MRQASPRGVTHITKTCDCIRLLAALSVITHRTCATKRRAMRFPHITPHRKRSSFADFRRRRRTSTPLLSRRSRPVRYLFIGSHRTRRPPRTARPPHDRQFTSNNPRRAPLYRFATCSSPPGKNPELLHSSEQPMRAPHPTVVLGMQDELTSRYEPKYFYQKPRRTGDSGECT